MSAIAIGMFWGSYFLALWGVAMIKGWNLSVKQLLSTSWPPDYSNSQLAA